MEKWRAILRRMFCLSPALTAVVAIPSFGMVAHALRAGERGPFAYAAYLASAYALAVTLTALCRALPRAADRVRGRLASRILRRAHVPRLERFFLDARFRAAVALRCGLAGNLLYVALKLGMGLWYRSFWFFFLALYYLLLAFMRVMLVWRSPEGDAYRAELRRCRACGVALLAMTQALAGIVAFMVLGNRGFVYPGHLIYLMALYAFTATVIAAVNWVKSARDASMALVTARTVNLAAALVSILSLETALVARFGDGDVVFRARMTGALGTAICAVVLVMALALIWRTTAALRGATGADG